MVTQKVKSGNPVPTRKKKLQEYVLSYDKPPTLVFKAVMPLPPGINQSYKVISHYSAKKKKMVGGIGATPALTQFKKGAAWMLRSTTTYCNTPILEAMKALKKPYRAPLLVSVTFYFKTMWQKDVDGGEKHAVDAAFKHIAMNDNLPVEINTKKFVDRDHQRCEIEVFWTGDVWK